MGDWDGRGMGVWDGLGGTDNDFNGIGNCWNIDKVTCSS
jgi:hypothetical protein